MSKGPFDRSRRGQSLVEVALVLPIFLVTLCGIIEFGWYSAVASATVSASREAARYGSTVGLDASGDPHYIDCPGIRAQARDVTESLITLADADIQITYDDGSAPTATACNSDADRPAAGELARFDRVVVEVTVVYQPVTPLLEPFIGTPTLVSLDRRSIVKAE